MKKVFLGGTCNESTWRNELIPLLEEKGIEYYNPVVEDWNPECQEEEYRQKEICDIKYCYRFEGTCKKRQGVNV